MHAVLTNALERVQFDLAGYGMSLAVRDEAWHESAGVASAYLMSAASGRVGIWITEAGGEQGVVELAEQVQDFVHEELCSLGLPAVWPVCPEHPSNHPMEATVDDGRACWGCPAGGQAIHVIGHGAVPVIADGAYVSALMMTFDGPVLPDVAG